MELLTDLSTARRRHRRTADKVSFAPREIQMQENSVIDERAVGPKTITPEVLKQLNVSSIPEYLKLIWDGIMSDTRIYVPAYFVEVSACRKYGGMSEDYCRNYLAKDLPIVIELMTEWQTNDAFPIELERMSIITTGIKSRY